MHTYINIHADIIHTRRLVQTSRLKASAILDMEVYYMAGMQGTRFVALFCSKLIPLLLSEC